MMNKNIRFLNDKKYITRANKEDETGKKIINGYGAIFNQKSKVIIEYNYLQRKVVKFEEVIETGAFDEVLQTNPNVMLNVNHNREKVLGKTESGTLRLSTDETGLKFENDLPNTTLGNDTFEMINRGDFYENSFAYDNEPEDERWEEDKNGNLTRYVSKVSKIYDVAITTDRGAFDNTKSEAITRSLNNFFETKDKVIEPEKDNTNERKQMELHLLKLKMKM